ncbi:MAG TPA: ABC transporter permease [Pyrinomonadaceae bacterium]|nr:ABC transporter permease [Pyrinomonadaceae bacterium]
MSFHSISTIAQQELTVNIRNRWTMIFAGVFSVLVLAISYFGLVTAGAIGFQGFARTSASLLNLVLYIIPLVALTMGTLSFTSDACANELLYSQPVLRVEVMLGKLLGLFASIIISTFVGFGLAGLIIGVKAGAEGASRYPILVAFSLLLALIFLSLSALISAVCKRQTKAFGLAVFVWFFFVLFYDLLVIGATILYKGANALIFGSLFGNPVEIVRVSCLMLLDGRDVFGAAGASLLKFAGGEATSLIVLAVTLALWIVVPAGLAHLFLRRQDI